MERMLTEEDWSDVQNVLHGRDFKWQAIGIQLHVAHEQLTRIKDEHGWNLEECNREMQIVWLKSGKATWGKLVAALSSGPVGLLEDAKRIEEKYLHPQSAAAGSHVECENNSAKVPPVTPELVPNQINLLSEQLEWLVKMGFAVEDIKKWARTKLESGDRDTTFNKDEESTTTMQPQPCGPCGTHAGNSESITGPAGGKKVPRWRGCGRNIASSLQSSCVGKMVETKSCSRKRKNSSTSPGKQPRAKRGRPSKASKMRSLSGGGEISWRPLSRLSVERGRQRTAELLKQHMMAVLVEIGQYPAAKELIERVDKERVANYDDVITKPMCLADMTAKVFEGAYKTPKMFCDDFNLIVDNCEALNGERSEYTQQARNMETKFYELVKSYFDDSSWKVPVKRRRYAMSPPKDPTSSSCTGEVSARKPSGSESADLMCVCEGGGLEVLKEASSEGDNKSNAVASNGDEHHLGGEIEVETESQACIKTLASGSEDTFADSEDDLPSFKHMFNHLPLAS